MKIEGHAVIPPPDWREVAAAARQWVCAEEEALRRLLTRREQIIRQETTDPLRYGWEPPIWKVADALIDFPICDPAFEQEIQGRFGWDWETWKARMREHLGFVQRVTMLLIMGANRSSKSEYAAKRGQMMLTHKAGANVYAFHMSNPRSVREQQPLFWKYMPPEWKHQKASVDEYIKYKKKTGFSDNSFINPLESMAAFLNYMQDRDTALEGIEADLVLPDELIPPDWVDTLKYRLATRSGRAVLTFTPINGYTPTVKIFCDSAQVARYSVGFMLPIDGGEPDPARTLGLTEEEYAEIRAAAREKRPYARAPQSRPEDVNAWLEEGKAGRENAAAGAAAATEPAGAAAATEPGAAAATGPGDGVYRPFGYGQAQPAVPEGRRFEMMPRVMRSVDRQLGVIFFHSENPYGNPKEVIDLALPKGRTEIRIRVYGLAEKTASCVFTKFDQGVHCIADEDVPAQGTNWMLVDPHGDRNFFMTWMRATTETDIQYREWPSGYEIPGQGVPDPWAVPSGRREGRNDGAAGGGQESFGFGLLRYKFEMARLEGWEDYLRWLHDVEYPGEVEARVRAVLDGVLYPDDGEVEDWDERNGAAEPMEGRIIDSRAASNPRVEKDRPVTLQTELWDIGLDFSLAPGKDVNSGVSKIVSALDYKADEAGSFQNRPHLLVARGCVNTVYALENWMNVDGDKGACKEPIDNLRYYYTGECGYVGDGDYAPRGGFYYGRGPTRGGRNARQREGAHPVPRPGGKRTRMRTIVNLGR